MKNIITNHSTFIHFLSALDYLKNFKIILLIQNIKYPCSIIIIIHFHDNLPPCPKNPFTLEIRREKNFDIVGSFFGLILFAKFVTTPTHQLINKIQYI